MRRANHSNARNYVPYYIMYEISISTTNGGQKSCVSRSRTTTGPESDRDRRVQSRTGERFLTSYIVATLSPRDSDPYLRGRSTVMLRPSHITSALSLS